MDFASPSTLSEIISSKRKILPGHMPKLLRGLKLNPNEKNFFETLVHLENAESNEEQQITEAIELSEKLNQHFQKIETNANYLGEYQLQKSGICFKTLG